MRKQIGCILLVLLLVSAACLALADGSTWKCTKCGRSGNTGNFCPNCGTAKPQDSSWVCGYCGVRNSGNFCTNCGRGKTATREPIYGKAKQKLAVNSGPGTKTYYDEVGTYNVAGQYCEILAKAWDKRNGIYWVKVHVPGTSVTGWTGLKRFDQSTFDINAVPEEFW